MPNKKNIKKNKLITGLEKNISENESINQWREENKLRTQSSLDAGKVISAGNLSHWQIPSVPCSSNLKHEASVSLSPRSPNPKRHLKPKKPAISTTPPGYIRLPNANRHLKPKKPPLPTDKISEMLQSMNLKVRNETQNLSTRDCFALNPTFSKSFSTSATQQNFDSSLPNFSYGHDNSLAQAESKSTFSVANYSEESEFGEPAEFGYPSYVFVKQKGHTDTGAESKFGEPESYNDEQEEYFENPEYVPYEERDNNPSPTQAVSGYEEPQYEEYFENPEYVPYEERDNNPSGTQEENEYEEEPQYSKPETHRLGQSRLFCEPKESLAQAEFKSAKHEKNAAKKDEKLKNQASSFLRFGI